MSNEALGPYTKNLKSLLTELGKDDAKAKVAIERILGWLEWTQGIGRFSTATHSHWNAARAVLPDMAAAVLRRKFTGDSAAEEVKACEGFLKHVAQCAALDAWRGLPEVDRLWPLLASPECAFLASHDARPTLAKALGLADVMGAGGSGGGGGGGGEADLGAIHHAPAPTASDISRLPGGRPFGVELVVGDSLEVYKSELGAWVPGQVVDVTTGAFEEGACIKVLLPALLAQAQEGPTTSPSGGSEWLSLSEDATLCRLAPLGKHTGKKTGVSAPHHPPMAPLQPSDPSPPPPPPPPPPAPAWVLEPSPADLAWRRALRAGSLVDALGAGGWRQAVVVHELPAEEAGAPAAAGAAADAAAAAGAAGAAAAGPAAAPLPPPPVPGSLRLSFLGSHASLDIDMHRSSPKLAPLNLRSGGARGAGAALHPLAETDQERNSEAASELALAWQAAAAAPQAVATPLPPPPVYTMFAPCPLSPYRAPAGPFLLGLMDEFFLARYAPTPELPMAAVWEHLLARLWAQPALPSPPPPQPLPGSLTAPLPWGAWLTPSPPWPRGTLFPLGSRVCCTGWRMAWWMRR